MRPLSESDLGRLNQVVGSSIKKNLVNYASCQSEAWIQKHFTYLGSGAGAGAFSMSLSPCVRDFVFSVKNLLLCLGILFPDQKRGLVKKQSLSKLESGFNIQMEIVMVRKLRSIELNDSRSQILLSSVKYFLKVLLERVRRMPQLKHYQQFQVDLYFVCQIFYELISVDEEGLICGFYLELLENAAMKSLDKHKLDQGQVEQLCNQCRTEMRI